MIPFLIYTLIFILAFFVVTKVQGAGLRDYTSLKTVTFGDESAVTPNRAIKSGCAGGNGSLPRRSSKSASALRPTKPIRSSHPDASPPRRLNVADNDRS